MPKKITYIIICCLLFFRATAQPQKKMNLLLDKMTSGIRAVLEDTKVPDSCNVNIRKFEEAFPRQGDRDLNAKSLNRLFTSANKFISSAGEKPAADCDQERTAKLIVLARQLADELKRLRDSLNVASAPVQFRIIVVDSNSNKPVNARLRIDSQGRALAKARIKSSDTGFYYALVVPKNTYRIKATAGQYDQYEQEFTAATAQDSLMVKMHSQVPPLPPADTVTRPDTVASTEAPEVQSADAEARLTAMARENATLRTTIWVLSILIAAALALCLVIWLKYKRMIKQALTGNRLPADQQAGETAGSSEEPASATEPALAEDPATAEEPVPAEERVPAEEPAPVAQPEAAFTATGETGENEMVIALAEPLVAPAGGNGDQSTPDAYFVCEIMMTAGPRKKATEESNADKDLGEDVCGFVSNAKEVMFWLLDGTSDNHYLKNPVNKQEYFSSRLLALCIAGKLRSYFTTAQPVSHPDMVSRAIREVRLDWMEVIDRLPEQEKLHVRKKIEDKILPECSATILVATLSIHGDFLAYRSGDSKMFLFSTSSENEINFVETSLMQKNRESDDRIFFSLRLGDDGKIDIICNEPLYEIVPHKNISEIISYSDGVGMETERLLRSEYKNAPDKVRKDIMYHSQETGDDKSICFIEIKKPSKP